MTTRHVEFKSSDCSLCGGTHYGSHECPFRCDRCTVNTSSCFQDGCPRNARFQSELAEAIARSQSEGKNG